VILLDSNVPMYLIGAAHPHKADAQRVLERLVSARERLVADAEVFRKYSTVTSPSIVATRFNRRSTCS
jgi:predicted nucleic acid-binding protein